MTVLDLPIPALKPQKKRPAKAKARPKKEKVDAAAKSAVEALLDVAAKGPEQYRLTLDEYHGMSDAGWFADRRVEFIDGEILQVAAQRNKHGCAISQSADVLNDLFPNKKFWVRVQMTLHVAGREPDPDLAVLGSPRRRDDEIPLAAEALLVIEVSDSTLLYDRTVKAGLYAAGGIAEYVIVNVAERQLEVHRTPVADATRRFGHRYDAITLLKPGDTFTPLAAPHAAIPVGDFM